MRYIYFNGLSRTNYIQNELEYDLVKFNRREGPFANARANLRDSQLAHILWLEKYNKHVPRLKKLALQILSQDCSS